MIKFNPDMLRIEVYDMKSCTTALGGSIRVVDHERTTEHEEVYNRLSVPLAVVRQFKIEYKNVNFIQPVLVAAVYYGDSIISLERHANGCGERFSKGLRGDMIEWKGKSQYNINKYVLPLCKETEANNEWFFDGRYMFQMKDNMEDALNKSTFLTRDGKFRVLEVRALGLNKLWQDPGLNEHRLKPSTRTCLAYVAADGQFAISPPIWKNVQSVGQAKILKGGYRSDDRQLDFDKVDTSCAVNISFALKAAAALSEHYGFEAIEPLRLPELMVRLNTVNLPKVAKEVKDTYDSGIQFTHALAWLLGYAGRAETMEAYGTIRSLLKYLTSRGMFFKDSFNTANIFKGESTIESIPHRNKEEALAKLSKLDPKDYVAVVRNRWSRTNDNRNREFVDEDGDLV